MSLRATVGSAAILFHPYKSEIASSLARLAKTAKMVFHHPVKCFLIPFLRVLVSWCLGGSSFLVAVLLILRGKMAFFIFPNMLTWLEFLVSRRNFIIIPIQERHACQTQISMRLLKIMPQLTSFPWAWSLASRG